MICRALEVGKDGVISAKRLASSCSRVVCGLCLRGNQCVCVYVCVHAHARVQCYDGLSADSYIVWSCWLWSMAWRATRVLQCLEMVIS